MEMVSLQLPVTNLHQFYLSVVSPSEHARIEDTPLVITTTAPKSSREKGNISTPLLGLARKELKDLPRITEEVSSKA